ncbi:MAG: NTP transferase domain-containing protein [Chloroflexota bacterium]
MKQESERMEPPADSELIQKSGSKSVALSDVVSLTGINLLNQSNFSQHSQSTTDAPVLVLLAAGKGTRFGIQPKCIQPVHGKPLARHSIDAFRQISPLPVICVVGYRYQEVVHALGEDNIYVRSKNPTGGTAFAAFESLSVPQLLEANPLLIITMGDRIVPAMIYQQLLEIHTQANKCSDSSKEAELTILTAQYNPPYNLRKGRILRDSDGTIIDIREQKDIEAEEDPKTRDQQLALTEGNCPLYMLRARTLYRSLSSITNHNAQRQYYITDMIANIKARQGEIRSLTTTPADPAYFLLCADVTRAEDLPRLEGILAKFQEEQRAL